MTEVLLGLDVGSTSFKAVAVGLDGRELAASTAPTPWKNQGIGTCLTPGGIRAAISMAIAGSLQQVRGSRSHVAGIGVTGMAEAGFLVDGEGQELAPALPWYDDRGADQARELAREVGGGNFEAATGLPLTPRCSAVKARWLLDEYGKQGSDLRWENLPEWAARQLGGRPAPELSLSARTGLLKLRSLEWIDPVLQWTGIAPQAMHPAVYAGTPAGAAAGALVTEIPELAGAVLTVAGHDHVCASVGAGATAPDDAFNSWGTGEALIRSLTAPLPDAEVSRAVSEGLTVGVHVLPHQWLLMAGLRSGRILHQVLTDLSIDPTKRGDLDARALRQPIGEIPPSNGSPGASDELPVPPSASAAQVWRTALEATGRNVAAAMDILASFTAPAKRIVATGGWLHSSEIVAMRHSTLGRFWIPSVQEATARGAALLAGVAAGILKLDSLPTPHTVDSQPTAEKVEQ